MRTPHLVASDLDGTLLDSAESVTRRTLAAVTRVSASETPFVLVTGRPPRWLRRIVDSLGFTGRAVCSNGAVVYDVGGDRVLRSVVITPAQLDEATGRLREALPGCAFAVERTATSARDRVDQQFLAEAEFHRSWPNRDIRVVGSTELTAGPAAKMLILHGELGSAEMVRVAEGIFGHRFRFTYSTSAGLIELSVPGADKASGLAAVAAEFGVSPEDILAFGDMPNDIPMLEWVGHGVAMRNAHPGVLDVADEVTASNEDDGVAQVLERWW